MRAIINESDEQVVAALRRRAEAALEIGRIKTEHGLPIFVGAREEEVLQRVCDANGEESVIPNETIRTLFRTIMKTSRAAQQGLTEKDTRVITGFRPTSDLTIGNYLGAVQPALELQEESDTELYFFVADVHGLTDTSPNDIVPYRYEVARDCIALGVNPEKSVIYMQSDVEDSVVQIANRLAPYMGVNELRRTPYIKEKTQQANGSPESGETANIKFSILGYPVLMAADIYAQQAQVAAVGNDQEAHLELAREMARRFNKATGAQILVEPDVLAARSLRILSLDGKGKMSKSNPSQAILLTDDPEYASQKINKAATAHAGQWNDALESHFMVAEAIAQTDEQHQTLTEVKAAHLAGRSVMSDFKRLWATITTAFLSDFQDARAAVSEADVLSALRYNADRAERNALQTLDRMQEAMGF